MKHFSFMNEAKVHEIEERQARSFHDYIDVRKIYEEELRKRHVYKKKIEEIYAKAQGLETKVASLKQKLDSVEKNRVLGIQEQLAVVTMEISTQTKELETKETEPRRMSIDAQIPQQGGEVRETIMKSMIDHRLETLKNISQNNHALYISLQDAEHVCNEELAQLSLTFNLWGAYVQFLERLIMLMKKKPNLPDKIITVKEGLDIVRELIGFFIGKLHII